MGLAFDVLDLEAAGGPATFARAEPYLGAVSGLTIGPEYADGTVTGSTLYHVKLYWLGRRLGGDCSCYPASTGAFCKHQVALGLAVLDRWGVGEIAGDDAPRQLEEDFLQTAKDILRTGGFVDYRRSFRVARDAEALLGEIEEVLDDAEPDIVRPALEYMTSRLRKIGEYAHDSGGVIVSSGQRALDLYARACREGHPDGTKLARWLLKFRLSSPGWPLVTLQPFAPAFDDGAWKVYRSGVAKAANASALDATFEVLQMQLELLDHDGDVDGAVAMLSADPQHIQYGAIIGRLAAAERTEDALSWLDRAVAANRIWHADDEYHRSFDTGVGMYLAAGRSDDALALRRRAFERVAGAHTFARLIDTAERLGLVADERAWAMATAEAQVAVLGSGAALVEIALGERDTDAALAAAERFGAGHQWKALADAALADNPGAAAALYQEAIEEELRETGADRYRTAVQYLRRVRDIYERLGRPHLFAAYSARIRAENSKRPTFLSAFDAAFPAIR